MYVDYAMFELLMLTPFHVATPLPKVIDHSAAALRALDDAIEETTEVAPKQQR